jgi:hypothetical protein
VTVLHMLLAHLHPNIGSAQRNMMTHLVPHLLQAL